MKNLNRGNLFLTAHLVLLTALPMWAQETASGVFRTVLRKPGDDGSKAYRIPGVATTPRGTLLAVFDVRNEGPGDLPGNIDVGAMRSTDNGDTWSPMQRVLDFDKSVPNSRGNGVGDPAILVDRETDAIFIAALWSHGDRGWHGSGPGMKPEETGQLVLTKSTDDGLTWSKPINITAQVKDPAWRLCFQGPGAGIQAKDGTLIFAAQFRDADAAPHSCFIYSRDHGATWTISPPAIPGEPPTSEAQIAELSDGSLLLTMRNESRSGTRAWARWEWSETTQEGAPQRGQRKKAPQGQWSKPWYTVPDPTCMASLVRHPDGKLLFSNPNSTKHRVALTIRTSADGGRAWSDGRLLDPRGCMYSCMTILDDGRVGILYEVEGTLTFARFPLSWVDAAGQLSLGRPFTRARLSKP
jgi:sialidase-1